MKEARWGAWEQMETASGARLMKGFSSLPSPQGAQRGFLDAGSSFPSPAPSLRNPQSGCRGVSSPSAAWQGGTLMGTRGPDHADSWPKHALTGSSLPRPQPLRRPDPSDRVGAGGGMEVGLSPDCAPPANGVLGDVTPPAAGASAEKWLYNPCPWVMRI